MTEAIDPSEITTAAIGNEERLRQMTIQYKKDLVNLVPPLMAFIRANYNKEKRQFAPGVLVNFDMVSQLLAQAGISEWYNIDKQLLTASQMQIEQLKKQNPETEQIFTPARLGLFTAIQQTKQVNALEFGRVTDAMSKSVMQQLLTMQMIPTPLKTVNTALLEQQGLSQSQAATVFNTALAMQQRTVSKRGGDNLQAAFPGREIFYFYTGPDRKDSETVRPFCNVLVGKAIPHSLIGSLDNNQKGANSVIQYGGGYNCRHSLTPVSKAYVELKKIKKVNRATVKRANAAAKRR